MYINTLKYKQQSSPGFVITGGFNCFSHFCLVNPVYFDNQEGPQENYFPREWVFASPWFSSLLHSAYK